MNDFKRMIDEELNNIRMSDRLRDKILSSTAGHTHRRRCLYVFAAVLALTIMIPAAVYAVTNLYKVYFVEDKDTEHITVVLERDGTESSSVDTSSSETADKTPDTCIVLQTDPDGTTRYIPSSEGTYYFLSFQYLPDGVRQLDGDISKYGSDRGNMGISPELVKLEGRQKLELPYAHAVGARSFEVNGYSCYIVYKPIYYNYDKEVGMILEDQDLLLEMFVGSDLSENEIEKILSGVRIDKKDYCEEGYTEMPAIVRSYEEFLRLWGQE